MILMNFKGSRTEKNLLAAFAGESQARTRYSFFASAARKEGYEQIGSAFQQTADEESMPGSFSNSCRRGCGDYRCLSGGRDRDHQR